MDLDDWGLSVLVPAVGEVVPLQRLKDWLRVQHSADDTQIYALGLAAADLLGAQHDRSILATTWRLSLPGFPEGIVRLRRGPVRSISQVQYRDASGVWVTLSSSAYLLISRDPAAIEPVANWPSTYSGVADAVRIDYVASMEAVPEPVRLAVQVCVSSWYGPGRGDGPDAASLDIPLAATSLMRIVAPGGYP